MFKKIVDSSTNIFKLGSRRIASSIVFFWCFRRVMDKEGGDGGDAAGKQPPDGLLDAANLFGGKLLCHKENYQKQTQNDLAGIGWLQICCTTSHFN